MTTTPDMIETLIGRTWHVLNNTKYAGTWAIDSAEPIEGTEWVTVRDGRRQWNVRLADCFATEADARAEARSRRQPRRARTARPLYGDFAFVAAINGICTDGTGRRAPRPQSAAVAEPATIPEFAFAMEIAAGQATGRLFA